MSAPGQRGIYAYTGGATTNVFKLPITGHFTSFDAVGSFATAKMIAGTADGQVFVSTDGGASWNSTTVSSLEPRAPVTVIMKNDFATSNMAIFASTRYIAPKELSNWLIGPAAGILNTSGCDMMEFERRISPQNFTAIVRLVDGAVITAGTAKGVLEEMFAGGKTAQAIIDEKGLAQISDTGALETAALRVIKDNPQAVADFKAGKAQAVKFMVGQLMRLSKGRANPNMAAEIITRKLGEL